MASALSYVSKFKSFVILFLTPILLLPLIILMPAKVSCLWAAWWLPGAGCPLWGTKPGTIRWSARIPGRARLPGGTHLLELRVLWEVPCEEF